MILIFSLGGKRGVGEGRGKGGCGMGGNGGWGEGGYTYRHTDDSRTDGMA